MISQHRCTNGLLWVGLPRHKREHRRRRLPKRWCSEAPVRRHHRLPRVKRGKASQCGLMHAHSHFANTHAGFSRTSPGAGDGNRTRVSSLGSGLTYARSCSKAVPGSDPESTCRAALWARLGHDGGPARGASSVGAGVVLSHRRRNVEVHAEWLRIAFTKAARTSTWAGGGNS